MERIHQYAITIKWTGNKGDGTLSYRSYDRSHLILVKNKAPILCSSDPGFLGDPSKHNPEELLVASLSACHMLWYLHLCAEAGVIVTDYSDQAAGTMQETSDGGGYFSEVHLYPIVKVADQSMKETAEALHTRAGQLCFIANSVKFPVYHHQTCQVLEKGSI